MNRPWAYYNEIDAFAAEWLRRLIKAGHIAPGYVDERSIEDVNPDELREFTQCHFFAGIGVWSLALRRAGWEDSRPVWTGSCPCQPFSAAGAGAGFDDDRHLWPDFHYLIGQRRPPVVFGEQVASKDAEPWLDLVQVDLEGLAYAFGCVPFPSAGVGAPHIRDRLFWVADGLGGVGDGYQPGLEGHPGDGGAAGRKGQERPAAPAGLLGGLADLHSDGRDQGGQRLVPPGSRGAVGDPRPAAEQPPAGPVNGFWRASDWLLCRDGKWRPVEAGTFPLAHGAPARVGRLRAYGNAINAEAAHQFIEAYRQARHC